MFDMDLMDFDVEKNKKKINCAPKNAFFSKRFFLDFFSILRSFYGKTFFLNPKWRLVSRWRFCHFKITLFSKNPLQ
jgi:hypothetical protein